ncbi:MobF family relaxase [Nocardioides sp. YIM 152315]|uniref:MobF family relaxase n=1 Tax=Nocardioides sp. YIM 152315 TaxID=3031760 RepID=UPI0023DBC765|nr:MobF family relaxase [Nocardioides sp. YIM 152315]MDF1606276.1 MobF family relaxase [Nocardioides sp. YIM 152315]
MVVSLRKMSAGHGYKYLLKTVVVGDGERDLSTPLTRYYAETGTPPGRWMGSGVADLGLKEGTEVTQAQLELLIGHGRHPVTGEQLGRAYPVYGTTKQKAVAGFDFSFSIPKSASVLWGVADAGTQAIIANAHHDAIRDVFDFMERELAATRMGVGTPDGAVAQVETTGFIATAYDHWDSRAGDPHLHTHVIVSNKTLSALDRKWRSLDSRAMYAWAVAVSELHQAVFADHLTRALGVGWEPRSRGRDRNREWVIAGVPQSLSKLFSSRASAIDAAADDLIQQYVDKHGHRPSRAVVHRIRNQASLATRPPKQSRSLAELTDVWRRTASAGLSEDATAWTRDLASDAAPRTLRADDVPLDLVDALASSVLAQVEEKRSTWRRANLYAEAARQTMSWRFASTTDREAVTGMIVDAAEARSLRLTPPELATVPPVFTRRDGTSVFRPRHSMVFSSEHLLAAEDRLLALADTRTAPTVDVGRVDRIAARPVKGQLLSSDQANAIATVATSARQLDLLIGPAGAGKTTAMRALREAWTQQHGRRSVVGLAPSAAAAQVLADDLGIRCENTAKWLFDHGRGHTAFTKDQLVILDEASLAGTVTLDRLTAHAADVGAKVLLVGDWAQLSAVEAGGAFGMLAAARDDTAQLLDVHRFLHEWEKGASIDLRHGRPQAIDAYVANDRVVEGHGGEAKEAAYDAWAADIADGRSSVLIADIAETVTDLNLRARADRLVRGETDAGRELSLVSGAGVSMGDIVITRRNDRRLRTLRSGWVRNGDRWIVRDARPDGSLVVRRIDRRFGGAVVLPASYVAEHVDLGYAVTAHRAQGLTVDTAHLVVGDTATRENFYVGMTRGRESNIAYVELDHADEGHDHGLDAPTSREVLLKVLANVGAEASAHQTVVSEHEAWGSIAQLAAEYETIAAAAQHDRWAQLIRTSGLSTEQAEETIGSDGFGPLTAELRRAEANGHAVETLLSVAVARHGLEDADDIASVLRHRVALMARAPASRRAPRPRLIAGLIPEALGPMSDDMRRALVERRDLIEQRARSLAGEAINANEAWVRRLVDPPIDRKDRQRWDQAVLTVAAYRDRYRVQGPSPLGARAVSDTQRIDQARALAAVRRVDLAAVGVRHDPAALTL